VSQRIDLNVELSELAATQTGIAVDAEVEVEGTIARLGQFIIRRKAGDIVRDFVRNVARELQAARARADRA
jgi:carbon monoxide dehydrogenase subunit G